MPNRNPLNRNTPTAATILDALTRHVTEIAFGIVEVVHIAIEHPRCKVAVTTTQPGVQAASVCIGKAGARARAIAADLDLDNVAIVTYSDDPTTYLTNAIAAHGITPLRVDLTDPVNRHARMVFDPAPSAFGPSQFARAIGSRGSNARLASTLTGWQIQICTPACVPGGRCIHPGATSPLAIAS